MRTTRWPAGLQVRPAVAKQGPQTLYGHQPLAPARTTLDADASHPAPEPQRIRLKAESFARCRHIDQGLAVEGGVGRFGRLGALGNASRLNLAQGAKRRLKSADGLVDDVPVRLQRDSSFAV
jgi:hypothetical protein